jgi:DNA uptake protein ComE-like DNA-binding protein
VSSGRIAPGDVSPEDAARILAVLNAAETPAALGAELELVDLPDVAGRLGEALLARRRELGGSFATLDQVASARGIGPVRFTRLVRALSSPPPLPPPRITPGEVTPADAFHILAVLNAARTAPELAATIELEDEPDVGLRLGQRLLDRRAQLGGAFTTLAQVDETPEIGPVRFTRIVRALRGAPLPPEPTLEDVVAGLQTAVGLLSQPPQVAVHEVAPGRYLGQTATVGLTVYGSDGRTQSDAVVTVSTSWGVLAAADGFSKQRGTAVVVRTAADGSLALHLEPPTSENIQGSEQRAVQLALDPFDPAAPTPAAVAPQLRELARAYRWEVNDELRSGIDVYFRDFHSHLLDRVNFLDELSEWTYEDAFVTASLLDADGRVAASASVLVRFKDWLGPWLQEHVALANEESMLSTQLGLAVHSAGVDELLTRVQNHVGRQVEGIGVVGEVVGRKVVDDAMTEFLSTHVDRLAPADQERVFASLNADRQTVVSAGAGVFGAIARTRVDTSSAVATGVAAVAQTFATKTELQAANASLATKADVQSALAGLATKAELQAELSAKVGLADLNTKLAAVESLADLRTGLQLRRIGP